MNCQKCGMPAKFIRDRHFKDGSGLVFMCNAPKCENYQLYIYDNPPTTKPTRR